MSIIKNLLFSSLLLLLFMGCSKDDEIYNANYEYRLNTGGAISLNSNGRQFRLESSVVNVFATISYTVLNQGREYNEEKDLKLEIETDSAGNFQYQHIENSFMLETGSKITNLSIKSLKLSATLGSRHYQKSFSFGDVFWIKGLKYSELLLEYGLQEFSRNYYNDYAEITLLIKNDIVLDIDKADSAEQVTSLNKPISHDNLLFYEDFETDAIVYTELKAKNTPVELLQDQQNHFLEVTYKGSSIGSQRVISYFDLARRTTSATLSFDVNFDQDFQFVKGGKLHGVAPDKIIAGGGTKIAYGWSSRINFNRHDSLSTYIYDQNEDLKYGSGISAQNFTFEKGKTYSISMFTSLNSNPTKKDGFVDIYINGTKVISHHDIQFYKEFATKTNPLISTFMFCTFHGGESPEYAPKNSNGEFVDVKAKFDNFSVIDGLYIKRYSGGITTY